MMRVENMGQRHACVNISVINYFIIYVTIVRSDWVVGNERREWGNIIKILFVSHFELSIKLFDERFVK